MFHAIIYSLQFCIGKMLRVNTNTHNPLIWTMKIYNKNQCNLIINQCVTLHQHFQLFFKSPDCATQGTT